MANDPRVPIVLSNVKTAILENLPPGVSVEYARGFFKRNGDVMASMLATAIQGKAVAATPVSKTANAYEAQYRKYLAGTGRFPKSKNRRGITDAEMTAIRDRVDAEHAAATPVEIPKAVKALKSLPANVIHQAPSGGWAFVGKVPIGLSYEHPDGTPLSETADAEIVEAIGHAGAGIAKTIYGVKARSWPTWEAAAKAAEALGYQVEGAKTQGEAPKATKPKGGKVVELHKCAVKPRKGGDIVVDTKGKEIWLYLARPPFLDPIAWSNTLGGKGSRFLSLAKKGDEMAKAAGSTAKASTLAPEFTWAKLVGGARTKARGPELVSRALGEVGFPIPAGACLYVWRGSEYESLGRLGGGAGAAKAPADVREVYTVPLLAEELGDTTWTVVGGVLKPQALKAGDFDRSGEVFVSGAIELANGETYPAVITLDMLSSFEQGGAIILKDGKTVRDRVAHDLNRVGWTKTDVFPYRYGYHADEVDGAYNDHHTSPGKWNMRWSPAVSGRPSAPEKPARGEGGAEVVSLAERRRAREGAPSPAGSEEPVIRVLQPRLNKRDNWIEYVQQLPGGEKENVQEVTAKVIERKRLSPEEYLTLTNNLLGSYDWMAGKGGSTEDANHLVIEVTAGGYRPIYIDPQGFNYARYVLFPADADASWHYRVGAKRRIGKREKEQAPTREEYLGHWRGSKADEVEHEGAVEVAKRVRVDLKDAFPPKDGWKFSVRAPRYSTLYVTVTQVPHGFVVKNPAWVKFAQENPNQPPPHGMGRLTEEADAALKRMKSLVNEYNYDRSDSMTDYFDRGFYETVEFARDVKVEKAGKKKATKGKATKTTTKKAPSQERSAAPKGYPVYLGSKYDAVDYFADRARAWYVDVDRQSGIRGENEYSTRHFGVTVSGHPENYELSSAGAKIVEAHERETRATPSTDASRAGYIEGLSYDEIVVLSGMKALKSFARKDAAKAAHVSPEEYDDTLDALKTRKLVTRGNALAEKGKETIEKIAKEGTLPSWWDPHDVQRIYWPKVQAGELAKTPDPQVAEYQADVDRARSGGASDCEETSFDLPGYGLIRVVCGRAGRRDTWNNIFVGRTRYGWNGKRWARSKTPPAAVLRAIREHGVEAFPSPDGGASGPPWIPGFPVLLAQESAGRGGTMNAPRKADRGLGAALLGGQRGVAGRDVLVLVPGEEDEYISSTEFERRIAVEPDRWVITEGGNEYLRDLAKMRRPRGASALPEGFESFPDVAIEETLEIQRLRAFERVVGAGELAQMHALAPYLSRPRSATGIDVDAFYTTGHGSAAPWYVYTTVGSPGGALRFARRLRSNLVGGRSGRGLAADMLHLYPRPLYIGWEGGLEGPFEA